MTDKNTVSLCACHSGGCELHCSCPNFEAVATDHSWTCSQTQAHRVHSWLTDAHQAPHDLAPLQRDPASTIKTKLPSSATAQKSSSMNATNAVIVV